MPLSRIATAVGSLAIGALTLDDDPRRRRAEVDADLLAQHCFRGASVADHAGEVAHLAPGLVGDDAFDVRAEPGELRLEVVIPALEVKTP